MQDTDSRGWGSRSRKTKGALFNKEAFMLYASLRRGLAVCLSFFLAFPVGMLPAASSTPVGTLRFEGIVYLGGERAHTDSVLYSGDHLRTADGRATISLPRGELLVLGKNSTVAFERSRGGLLVGLEKGQLALAASPQLPVRVETDGLTVSPTGTFPGLAEVALREDGSVAVAVRRGTMAVANLRAEPVIVAAGELLTVSPRLAQAEKSRPVGTAAHGKMTLGEKLRTFRIGRLSHAASVGVLAGIIGGAAAAAIIVPLTVGEEKVSPSAP